MIYGRLEVKDLAGNLWVVGAENRGYTLTLSSRRAGTLELEVHDPQGVYEQRYPVGGEVYLYADASPNPTALIFTGVIEGVWATETPSGKLLRIQATEKFWVQALGRLVQENFSGKKAGEVARLLVQKYLPGFSTTQIEDTDTLVEFVQFRDQPLKQCLDTLAELAGATYYATPEGEVHFHPKETREDPIRIDEGMVKATPTVLRDLSGVKTVVVVQGGVSLKLDAAQEDTTAGSVALDDREVAVKLTPQTSRGRYLELCVARQGSPGKALTGRVVEDAAGEPSGPAREFFAISEQDIGPTGWVGVEIDLAFEAGASYWVVLNRVGTATDTYLWLYGQQGERMERSDTTWTLVAGAPAYRLYGGNPIVARAVNPGLLEAYGYREEVVERPEIVRYEDAKRVAYQRLAELSRLRLEFEALRVVGLDRIPQPGRLIELSLPRLGFEGKVVVEEVVATFPPGLEGARELVLTVGEDPEALPDLLTRIEERLESSRRKALDPAQAILNRSDTFLEPLPLQATLYSDRHREGVEEALPLLVARSRGYAQVVGAFRVGWCKVGYATCG